MARASLLAEHPEQRPHPPCQIRHIPPLDTPPRIADNPPRSHSPRKVNQKTEQHSFRRKKGGFSLFGLNKQDFIRYFFGGNASLAIFILILICVFLFLQGRGFFPESHDELQIARGSGIDLYDLVDDEYGDIKRFTGKFNSAFTTEYANPGLPHDRLAKTHESIRFRISRETRRDRAVLKDIEKQLNSAKTEAELQAAAAEGDSPDEKPAFAVDPVQAEALSTALSTFADSVKALPAGELDAEDPDAVKSARMAALRALFGTSKPAKALRPPEPKPEGETTKKAPPLSKEKLTELRDRVIARIAKKERAALDGVRQRQIREAREISAEDFGRIKKEIHDMADKPTARADDFPLLTEFNTERDRLNDAARPHAQPLNDTFLSLKKAQKPLDDLWTRINKQATGTANRSRTAATVVNRIRGPFGVYRGPDGTGAPDPMVCAKKLGMVLRECATAEFFHPVARLYYIAAADTLLQDDLQAAATALAEDARSKAAAAEKAGEKLSSAVANPADLEALRAAAKEFEDAQFAAQSALVKFKPTSEHFTSLFSGSEGKAALEKLQGYLETIQTALPDYRNKIQSGTFTRADLDKLATVARAKPGGQASPPAAKPKSDPQATPSPISHLLSPAIADRLLATAARYKEGPIPFFESLVEAAPDAQIPFPYAELAEPLYAAAKEHRPIVEKLKGELQNRRRQACRTTLKTRTPDATSAPSGAGSVTSKATSMTSPTRSRPGDTTKSRPASARSPSFLAGSKWTTNSAIQRSLRPPPPPLRFLHHLDHRHHDRRPLRPLRRDLRQPDRRPPPAPDPQALHRVHRDHPLDRPRLSRGRDPRRHPEKRQRIRPVRLDARPADRREAEHAQRRPPPRLHGHPHHLLARRGRPEQRPPALSPGLARPRGHEPPDRLQGHRPHRHVRYYRSHPPRLRACYRRDHGRPPRRRGPHFAIPGMSSPRSSGSASTPPRPGRSPSALSAPWSSASSSGLRRVSKAARSASSRVSSASSPSPRSGSSSFRSPPSPPTP